MAFISIIAYIVFIITIFYCLLILFYTIKWQQIKTDSQSQSALATTVSVIIPVRNEASNVEACLIGIMKQSYPDKLVEIIIVNDHSEDSTFEVVEKFCLVRNESRCSLINLSEKVKGKKAAIKKGIERASGELIITTDADCEYHQDWIKTIMIKFEETQPELIVSPVILKSDPNFFNVFQQYEVLSFAGLTGASVKAGFPLMCNGANLAFKRKTFLEINAMRNDEHILSGDDAFLLFKIKEKYPDKICFIKSPEAVVMTAGQQSWISFWEQRKRWASKVGLYSTRYVKWVGGIIYLMSFVITAFFLTGFWYPEFLKLALYGLLAKSVVDVLFLRSVFRFFNQLKLMIYFLPVQVIYLIYLVFIVPVSLLNKYTWKGRSN